MYGYAVACKLLFLVGPVSQTAILTVMAKGAHPYKHEPSFPYVP
jgi:hypothetical protein